MDLNIFYKMTVRANAARSLQNRLIFIYGILVNITKTTSTR
jgi:hypothetical protein